MNVYFYNKIYKIIIHVNISIKDRHREIPELKERLLLEVSEKLKK